MNSVHCVWLLLQMVVSNVLLVEFIEKPMMFSIRAESTHVLKGPRLRGGKNSSLLMELATLEENWGCAFLQKSIANNFCKWIT